MVQLRVYTSTDKTEQHWLDLYKESPIKLNLSVEDITTAEAKSTFSRTFRVPATDNNTLFFKTAFAVEGLDYDVTIKKPAEILVDGAMFRQGHIRLQKVFLNERKSLIDYEILFLGETRDFASAIGDAAMCNLDLDLSHVLNAANVQSSWQAYPESASGTAGLLNGDVLYPLIDHGMTYDNSGNPDYNQIAVGSVQDNFTSNGHPIQASQFKPMIRAKAIWDAIFDAAGYTYTSDFIEPAAPNEFTQMYVSAFGNVATPLFEGTQNSANNCEYVSSSSGQSIGDDDPLYFPFLVSDPNNNFTTGTQNSGSFYTAPLGGTYEFFANSYFAGFSELPSPQGSNVAGRLRFTKNGSLTSVVGNYGYGQTISVSGQLTLVAGDEVQVIVEAEPGYPLDQAIVRDGIFKCTSAPGQVNPVSNMDCEYKQIDFIKDVLTTFRLVMAPDANDPQNFIIEPFTDYINSGTIYDWSDKLMLDKDIVVEPLFFTQSDQITFNHGESGEYLSTYHRDAYGDNYGYLEFDSGNDLLKGTREIKTKWASTPLTQINGAANTAKFIIPRLHVHEAEDWGTAHLPIKPKTRFLFYNGLQSVNGSSYHWHVDGISGHLDEYPLVSYSSTWPMSNAGLVLNWFNDIDYWGTNVSGFPTQLGSTMYDVYWSGYVGNLYDKFARRVTAYFILNNVDLQDFTFDDVIFCNGSYYRAEKIIDAQIGNRAPVKVQMIKLLSPPYFPANVDRGTRSLEFSARQTDSNAACNATGSTVYFASYQEGQWGVGQYVTGMNRAVVGASSWFRLFDATGDATTDISNAIRISSSGQIVQITSCGPPPP